MQKSKEVPPKTDLESWPGGMPLDLEKEIDGVTLRERLEKHVKEELDRELENQDKLLEDISKWQNQFKGNKKKKSKPWVNSANVAVPITRSAIENILVRLEDSIFNRRKPFIVKARKPEYMGLARETEDALEWLMTKVIKLREKLKPVINQALKVGTGIVHMAWVEERRTIYRWKDDSDEHGLREYKVKGSKVPIVKDTQSIYNGPQVYSVPREDIVVSSDAINVNDAYMIGFRRKYRKSEIDVRVKNKIWDKDAVAKIMNPDAPTTNEETRAKNQGKTLDKTDYSKPFEFWTVWIKYDVDDDGEPDDLMLTVHRNTGSIVRGIYSPTFTSQRPFVKIVPNPTEYAFDGEGICEVLYNIQEEIDTIHNQRLDRMAMVNSIMTITQSGSGLDNFMFEPGKNWVCDGNVTDVFREVKFSDSYPSTYQEEANLISLADRVTGNTPAVQGVSTAERPVFKETQAMLGESNKKFKSMIDNIVAGITEIAYLTLELYSQYDPMIRYQAEEDGKMVDKSITLPLPMIRDGLDITLAASTDIMSQETRRSLNQELYMMSSDYLTKLATVAQALTSPGVPPEFKKFLLMAGHSSAKFYRDVLLDSERPDADELAVDLAKIFSPQEIQKMMTPAPPQPPMGKGKPGGPKQGPPGGPSGPPQGPPPGMMPQGGPR
ncbi:MAG: hypothetical protein WC455_27470 [Dehalococcoidia bacterium]